jgi:pyrimidine-nucleoside phosphorylase
MEFLPAELIRKKRFGQPHSQAEIRFILHGMVQGSIPDYQVAAWLMAICFQGMTDQEIAWLTQEMCNSGLVLDLSDLGVTVDKHSTGGVGDKTSLILAPLVAAAGVPVPMMAGRGLGHTGGTLDKLESISGFSVQLSTNQFKKQIQSVGAAIIGQSAEICPADRKLYALRDVTGTVDCLPLICGSIMSKKLAEGMSALVLDVKYGSGAFMKSLADCERLARALIAIGAHANKRVTALLSRMDEPLGRFIGNALEVQECLDILAGRSFSGVGKGYDDTLELTLELAGQMICLGGKAATPHVGRQVAEAHLRDGSALRKFHQICEAQGGNLQAALPKAARQITVLAETAGYFKYTDVEKLGLAAVRLGAGRSVQGEALDLAAGIEVFCANGAELKVSDPLFTLFAADEARLEAAKAFVQQSYQLTAQPVSPSPLIAKVIL